MGDGEGTISVGNKYVRGGQPVGDIPNEFTPT